MLEAVIFDLDGTLVDSEQHGHRVAFNAAFEAFGLPDRWEPDRYRALLATTGGERRIFGWLSSPDSSCVDRTEEERRELAKALHRWKTDRVTAMAAAGEIPPRDGVTAWLEGLAEHGVRLAVATTGSRQWALPLIDKAFGLARFETVVAGDDVTHRKPDPEAYLVALDRLRLPVSAVVAVEDSAAGWESARAAGVACAVVCNDETDRDRVAGADLLLDAFDPDPFTLLSSLLDPSTVRGRRPGAAN
ncbi:MAG TPA: HAD-IA family hydrolase [Acidimicrobiales bacterium]|nr:HAD-IA family hydrolase [Acidimicrobiales bacterium]